MSQTSDTPMDRPGDGPNAAAIDSPSHVSHQASQWLREFLADLSKDWAQRLCGGDADEGLP